MKRILFLLLIAKSSQLAAQNIGIGTTTPNASAQLDISSTTKGALIPRMTTTQRKAIVNPEPGLIVFDTDKRAIFMYQYPGWGQLAFKNTEEGDLIPYNASANQPSSYFGSPVAMNDDYAAISSPMYTNANGQVGAVFVFHRINGQWTEEAIITASDAASGDRFGRAVAMSDDYLVVGAPEDDNSFAVQGSVYVFAKIGNNWVQQTKIIAADGAAQDYFGNSIAIDGGNILIGSPMDDISGTSNQGSAYLFSGSGTSWTLTKKIVASDGTANERFGTYVSISGIYATITCPADVINASSQGSVYIFNGAALPSWSQAQKITAPADALSTEFASAAFIKGDTIVIASNTLMYTYYRGALNVWTKAMDHLNFDGYILTAFSGEYAVTAHPGTTFDAGKIWIYKKNGNAWELRRQITDPFFIQTSFYVPGFGTSASVSGYNMVIGVPGRNNAKGEVQFTNIQ